MKKLFFLTTLMCLALMSVAQVMVQGVPRYDIKRAPALMADDATAFTFDDVQNWTGEGSNRAMLVIQWNDENETNAMAFGYRWDGDATGYDMAVAVIANNPRLYGVIQTGTAYGATIGGFGWDVDGNGEIGLLLNGETITAPESGIISGTQSNFDKYTPIDAGDFWGSGWYSGYWSYWLKTTSTDAFKYASTGASGRKLVDGCWDGWNFSKGMGSYAWKTIVAAPGLIPDDAQREFTVDGLCYSLKGWTETLKTVWVCAPFEGSNIEYKGDITVPASITVNDITYQVVGVADSAFAATPNLNSVILPDQVTTISNAAFAGSAIKSVNYSAGLKKLGENVFNGCSNLASIIIPTTITAIPTGTFEGTAVKAVDFPENITAVGDNAFKDAKIENLVVNTTITEIGANAFAGCPITAVKSMNLKPATCGDNAFDATTCAGATLTVPAGYIDVYKEANVWKDFVNFAEEAMPVHEGDIFAKSGVTYKITAHNDEQHDVVVTYAQTDNTTATGIQTANRAFYTEAINIPAQVNYQNVIFNVVAITDSAFYGANTLKGVTIEDGKMKSIGRNAFYMCSNAEFKSLVIPESVTEIKPAAFRSASKLESVTLPSTMTEIPDSLFASCSALASIDIPEGVTRIGKYAFGYCSKLAQVTVPQGLKEICDYGFYWAAFPEINIPETVTTIGESAFSANKALTTFNWPAAATTIPDEAFWGCSGLKTVNIPETVNSIGTEVFKGCSVLESMPLPATVSVWPKGTFYNCKALTEVTIPEGVTAIGEDVFNSCAALTTVVFPNSLTSIGNGAFSGCNAIKNIELPERFTVIPEKLFMNCLGLETVKISSQATKIGTSAFNGCKALTTINMPATIDTIGNMAFNNCPNVAITLPEGLKYLGSSAFVGNLTITDVTIPEGVETLNAYVFQKCSNLKTVKGLGRFTQVPNYLFSECSSLESVDFEPNITSVGSYAFYKCTNLETVDFGENLETLGGSALSYDNKFTDIVFTPNFKSLGTSNFYYNDSIMIWSARETPVSATSRYALGVKSGSSYANVTVLNGTLNNYSGVSMWNNCALRELDINGIAAAETEETEILTNSATLTLNVALTYANEENVPAAFQKYNSKHYMDNASQVVVEYEKAQAVASPALKAMENATTVEAQLDENGNVTAQLEGLKEGTTYAYRVKVLDAAGEEVNVSETYYFTTPGRTAIDTIDGNAGVAKVKYYNVAGIESDAPFHGVNIVVTTLDNGTVVTTKQVIK